MWLSTPNCNFNVICNLSVIYTIPTLLYRAPFHINKYKDYAEYCQYKHKCPSSVRQSPIHFLLKSFISQKLFNNTVFSCLAWSFLKNVTMHCKRKLWVGGRVCINKGEALDRGTKCRAGGEYGRGVPTLRMLKKIEIRDCLDVFWSNPNSKLLCVFSILKEQIFDILWSLTYVRCDAANGENLFYDHDY